MTRINPRQEQIAKIRRLQEEDNADWFFDKFDKTFDKALDKPGRTFLMMGLMALGFWLVIIAAITIGLVIVL